MPIDNYLEKYLQNSRHELEHIVHAARRLNKTQAKAVELLDPMHYASPLHRRAIACAIISSLADDVIPDASYLAQQIGIHRPTLLRWYKKLDDEAYFVRDGRRKVLVIDRACNQDMVDLLDWHVDYHKANELRCDRAECPNKPNLQSTPKKDA